MRDLTAKERKAIGDLKRVAATWPKSLWLFSASGTLCVMMKDADGERVRHPAGNVDAAWVADDIRIENDGGDW
jgi:hypothetical protein